jgi:hypothetical protein
VYPDFVGAGQRYMSISATKLGRILAICSANKKSKHTLTKAQSSTGSKAEVLHNLRVVLHDLPVYLALDNYRACSEFWFASENEPKP